jgi:hypothetical protein
MTSTERKFRDNLREVRRLQIRLSTGAGRNVGATEAALDRRLAADKRLLEAVAVEEERIVWT